MTNDECRDDIIPEYINVKGKTYKVADLTNKVSDVMVHKKVGKSFKAKRPSTKDTEIFLRNSKLSMAELRVIYPEKSIIQLRAMQQYARLKVQSF